MKIPNARELAILCMIEVEDKHLLVSQAFSSLGVQLKSDDMALAHEITYGTFRYLTGLDRILGDFCRKPLEKLPVFIQWLLRSSVYQLLKMRTPHYAVINESVKLTENRGFPGLKPVVNGILRQVQRKADTAQLEKPELPLWFDKQMREAYGDGLTNHWLEELQKPPLISYWSLEPDALEHHGSGLEGLPHSRLGTPDLDRRHYVQNESAQAVSEIVCRSGVERVWDYCAAPGGKSSYLAAFGQFGKLAASDISSARLVTMQHNFSRLGVEVEILDLSQANLEVPPFDLILVDAPCSSLGIIARHPEIGFHRKNGTNPDLFSTQAEILKAAWSHVKPGGYLFYVICTLDPREWPEWPEDAQPAGEQLSNWSPSGVPFVFPKDAYFYIRPSNRFDGFSGFLIQKQA